MLSDVLAYLTKSSVRKQRSFIFSSRCVCVCVCVCVCGGGLTWSCEADLLSAPLLSHQPPGNVPPWCCTLTSKRTQSGNFKTSSWSRCSHRNIYRSTGSQRRRSTAGSGPQRRGKTSSWVTIRASRRRSTSQRDQPG